MAKTFGCCRFVYNHYLDIRKKAYEAGKTSISSSACQSDMAGMKNTLTWLKEVDSTALQASIQNLDAAYQNFFRGVKSGKHVGYPRFKSKRDSRQSFKSKKVGDNIKVLDRHIRLPKLGYIDCRVSKRVEGRILSVTVTKTPSRKYYVAICCTDVDIAPLPSTGNVVGVDLGLIDLITTSDNQKTPNHRHLAKSQKKLASLQRRLSRKQKGSNRRDKAKVKVARLHERITNQRNDALHKLSTNLVRDYDLIAIENLAPSNMVKNRRLAKSILDVSWSEFVRQLEYKCGWYGKHIVKVDRFFPSSQLCSVCGFQSSITKDLSVREWVCTFCGTVIDRDANAAVNILNEGLRVVADTAGQAGIYARGEYVRPMAATLGEAGIPRL